MSITFVNVSLPVDKLEATLQAIVFAGLTTNNIQCAMGNVWINIENFAIGFLRQFIHQNFGLLIENFLEIF